MIFLLECMSAKWKNSGSDIGGYIMNRGWVNGSLDFETGKGYVFLFLVQGRRLHPFWAGKDEAKYEVATKFPGLGIPSGLRGYMMYHI